MICYLFFFFFSSRRRHTRCGRDWSSDVCSSDLAGIGRRWWAPNSTAATWPTVHTSRPAARRTAPRSSQIPSVAGYSAYGGRRSRHIRTAPLTVEKAMKLLARNSPLAPDLPAWELAFLEASVVGPHRHSGHSCRLGNGVCQKVAVLFDGEVCGRLDRRHATISTHVGLQSLVPGSPGGERCGYTDPSTAGALRLPARRQITHPYSTSSAWGAKRDRTSITLPYLWLGIKVHRC